MEWSVNTLCYCKQPIYFVTMNTMQKKGIKLKKKLTDMLIVAT